MLNEAAPIPEAEALLIAAMIAMQKLQLPIDHPTVLAEMERLLAEYEHQKVG